MTKRASDDFTPSNELEVALVKAARQPAEQTEFYEKLLSAQLFFLTPDVPRREEKRTAQPGEGVTLVSWTGSGGPFLPFFSSQQRMLEAVSQGSMTYGFIAIRGREVFEMLGQAPGLAVLNPGLSYGKEFSPEEIRRISDGSIFAGERITVERATQVFLGQPAVYPQDLVDALSALFANHTGVRAAFLAQIHDPSSAVQPHPIIGILADDYDEVVHEAGAVAERIIGSRGPVDFIDMSASHEGLTAFLYQQTNPFFDRRT